MKIKAVKFFENGFMTQRTDPQHGFSGERRRRLSGHGEALDLPVVCELHRFPAEAPFPEFQQAPDQNAETVLL